MARPKEPINLIMAKGNVSHKTKEEIEERKKSEIHASVDNISAPSYLIKRQKLRFDYLANELLEAKIFTNLDVESLARYVVLEDQFHAITKALNKLDISSIEYDKMLIKQTKTFAMLDKLNDKLCFNIMSRAKVAVPRDNQEKPKNKFEKFGGAGNG